MIKEGVNWYAIRTKYKSEKMVRDRLIEADVDAYVPLFIEEKRYLRKVKRVEKPIIASYVFVHISKEEYVKVLKTLGVASFLKIGKEIYTIPEKEIEILKKIVGEFDFDTLEIKANDILEGDRVEILGGKLTGVKGLVVDRDKNKKVVVQLKTIGIDLSFEVESKYLRKI